MNTYIGSSFGRWWRDMWPNTSVGHACFLVQQVISVGPKQKGFVGWTLFNRVAHPILSTLPSVPWTLIFFAWPVLLLLGSSVAPLMADWRRSFMSQENLWALVGRGLLNEGGWLILVLRRPRPHLPVTWSHLFVSASEVMPSPFILLS